jgi:ankyrin repeat protein
MIVSQEGRTALMLAAKNGHIEAVKALIEKGADVNATEKVRHRHFFSALFQYRRRND